MPRVVCICRVVVGPTRRCACISLASGSAVESHGPRRHELVNAFRWALSTVDLSLEKGGGRQVGKKARFDVGLGRGILIEASKQDGDSQADQRRALRRTQCGPGPGEPINPAGMLGPKAMLEWTRNLLAAACTQASVAFTQTCPKHNGGGVDRTGLVNGTESSALPPPPTSSLHHPLPSLELRRGMIPPSPVGLPLSL